MKEEKYISVEFVVIVVVVVFLVEIVVFGSLAKLLYIHTTYILHTYT